MKTWDPLSVMLILGAVLLVMRTRQPVTLVEGVAKRRKPKPPAYYSGVSPRDAGARPIPTEPNEAKREPIPNAPTDDVNRWLPVPNEGQLKGVLPLISGFELAALIEFRPAAKNVIVTGAVDPRSVLAVETWLLDQVDWKMLTVTADPKLVPSWPEPAWLHFSPATPAIFVMGMPGRTLWRQYAVRPEQMTRLWVRRALIA